MKTIRRRRIIAIPYATLSDETACAVLLCDACSKIAIIFFSPDGGKPSGYLKRPFALDQLLYSA